MSIGMRWLAALISVSAVGMFGCAEGLESKSPRTAEPEASESALIKTTATPATPAEKASKSVKSATSGRKIIYNAHVDLVTEDLTSVDARLMRLIESSKGYVADSDLSGTTGSNRHATWRVRIPVDAYDAFIRGVTSLGELVSLKADTQDVSEEYFDIEARQSNKKVEEARLLKHLTDSTGKLDDILQVEREISRVRGEIEQMQGRLRALANLTSLTTVTISVREIKNYQPPQAPTFLTRLARTFSDSLELLRSFGESVAMLIAGSLPWLPLIAIGFAIYVSANRKRQR